MPRGPRAPHDLYSPERPTAVVLSGAGADGAYHAGVLKALHDAGVKVDLVAGRGVGVLGAVLSAVDGAALLWEPLGFWRRQALGHSYRPTWQLSRDRPHAAVDPGRAGPAAGAARGRRDGLAAGVRTRTARASTGERPSPAAMPMS